MPTSKFKVNLMLDSGAYSAWRRGDTLKVKDYAEYIKRHKHLVESYVSMDCIPGEKGEMKTGVEGKKSIEQSAKISADNHEEMKSYGLEPIPVFHMGENFKWLDKMLKDGEKYIGISPYLRAHPRAMYRWFDDCFDRLTDSSGQPFVKTHGFGVTMHTALYNYPFTTVDSTSWTLLPGYGYILVPFINGEGKCEYHQAPTQLQITGNTKHRNSIHKMILGNAYLDFLPKFLAPLGLELLDVRNSNQARMKAVLYYYMELGKAVAERNVTFKRQHATFFHVSKHRSKKGWRTPLRILFSAGIQSNMSNRMLTSLGIRDRLMSYYWLREYEDAELENYIDTGARHDDASRTVQRRMGKGARYYSQRRMHLIERVRNYQQEREKADAEK